MSLLSSVIQSPIHVWLFVIQRAAACQASLSLTISWSLPKFMSIALVCYRAISSSDALFSFCPQSFPASGTFPISWLFSPDDQNTGASASASVLLEIQGWFPSRLTGFIFSLSKGQESSPAPQFEGIKFLALCLLYSQAQLSKPYMTPGRP